MSKLRTVSRAEALRAHPELGMLDLLRQAPGWNFRRDVDEAGEVTGIVGSRAADAYVDLLLIYSETCCAARVLPGVPGAPPAVVWEFSGPVGEAVLELLALPEPGHRLAPGRIRRPVDVPLTVSGRP